jgi:hypothetical protein
MEINVEKTKVMRISRQSSPLQIMTSKTMGNVEYLNYLGSLITNDARCHVKLNPGLLFNNKETLLTSKLDLNLRTKLLKCYIWSIALYGAETWTPQKVDYRNTLRVLKWGAEEGWRRLIGMLV